MTTKEDCRGCHVNGRCHIKPKLQNKSCPCTNCIVKPICTLVCNPQIEYSRLYLRYFRNLEYKRKKELSNSEFFGDIAELTRSRIIAGDALLKRIKEQGPKISLLEFQKYYLSVLENRKIKRG
jgi:hypothetical protein